ncbi:hypothetical protein GM661_06005 [Iocasia frigidifontis]|uniref:Sugar fermentation stimulation protein C-terminal domain-containing protein n=1 Tax=Iocasia fonsfrigidae TaxID=2682810 RepID=A0A8A7KBU8_9FIRM|nr:DNA/RNA nuclease SfsA [Iocasia fonsfrigidae]QTL97565.1 hypothetical protein GM661_06005 [Iocasia fonsfrigidae]
MIYSTSKVALFPEAPTNRETKHVKEMVKARELSFFLFR